MVGVVPCRFTRVDTASGEAARGRSGTGVWFSGHAGGAVEGDPTRARATVPIPRPRGLSLSSLSPARVLGGRYSPVVPEHPLPQAQLPILLYVLAMMRHEPDLLQPETRRSATCPPLHTSRDPRCDGGVVALTLPRLVTERCSGRLSSSSSGSSGPNSNAPRTSPPSSRCFKALSSRLILTGDPHLPPSS